MLISNLLTLELTLQLTKEIVLISIAAISGKFPNENWYPAKADPRITFVHFLCSQFTVVDKIR